MTVKDILAGYLKSHGFDGLCHPRTERGCGLDDLIGPCMGAQQDCRSAYRVFNPLEKCDWYIVFDHRPTEEEVLEYWEMKRSER
jgi:hypothetical protein